MESYALGKVLETIIDYRGKTPPKSPTGIPTITAANVKDGRVDLSSVSYVSQQTYDSWTTRGFPEPGDVLITTEAPVGEVAPFPGDRVYLITRRVIALRPTPSLLDKDYLLYFLLNPLTKALLLEKARGSTVPRVLKTDITGLEILAPNLSNQKTIAGTLKALDDKIELNRKMNQTLEAMAQAIFKSWFVDFDPVKAKQVAKARGRDPERAAMSALGGKLRVPKNPADLSVKDLVKAEAELDQLGEEERKQLEQTAALFPDGFVESELGLIPEGWIRSTIGEEVETVGGGTPSTKNPAFWEEGTFNWVTPKDLSGLSDKVLLSTSRTITEEGLEEISSGLLPTNTVLMSSRAPVGYLALTQIETAINQGFIAMKCNGRLPPRYVLQWANSNIDLIRQMASGSTFAEISKKTFRPFPILVPSAELLEAFENHVRPIYKRIAANAQQSETLGRIRDTLLPRLLSGEIYLGDSADE